MKRALRALTATITAVLLLSGCLGNNPSVAATVGTSPYISETQLTTMANALAEFTGERNFSRSQTLYLLLIGKIASDASGNPTIGTYVNTAAIAQLKAAPDLAALVSNPKAELFLDDLLASQLLMEAANSDAAVVPAMQAASMEQEVIVHPRYGSWNPQQLAFDGNGSLSRPASEVLR
ncbi:MAG: hypothetical protein FWG47_05915 [Propionibacteriaceae bacterium]|nr:hypothetical protein [Propionibacteriaceae bacterium]